MKHAPLRIGLALAAILPALSSAHVTAQSNSDPWLPWQGCWRAEGAPTEELLCVVPDGGGVRLVTLEKGVVRSESRVIADNKPRAVKQDGCTGSEVARWSADRRRIFLISQLTCDQNIARQVSGVFAVTGARDWISAQAVTIEGRTATRSVRYVAVEPAGLPAAISAALRSDRLAVERARNAAAAEVTEAEINEATTNVEAAAVQEWLNASGQPFQIEGATPTAGGAPTTISALDLVGRVSSTETVRYAPEQPVEVVERSVTYVNNTYVNTVVRSCWDPFFAGYVIGVTGGLSVGVSYGRPLCGGRYYSRYSPWGYDLYGWHWVPAPVVIVRGGPTIIRTSPVIIRHGGGGGIHRDWDDGRRDSWGGRATRDGYVRDNGYRDNNPGRDNRSGRGDNYGRDNGRGDRDRAGSTGRPGGTSTRGSRDDHQWSSGPNRGGAQPPRTGGSTRPTDRPSVGRPTTGSRSGDGSQTRATGSTGTTRPSGYTGGSSGSTGRTARPRSSSR